jgi:transcriptional regulator with XRE-family HTH domain
MLSEALRLLRIFHDCKTSDLAKELGISASYISEIESNKKTPSIETIKKYAEHFDTTPAAIMFFAEDIEKDKKRPAKAAIRKKLIKFLQIIENVAT